MKTIKKALLLIFLIGALLAGGCQWEVANLASQPAIISAQLTEKEQQLITAVGVERIFAFDINLDTIDFDQLEYKVDYYQDGNHVETVTHGAMGSFLEGGTHRFMWSQTNTGTNKEQLWHVAFAGGRMTQQIELPEELTAWGWSQADQVETIQLNEPVMLAALVGTSTDSLRGPAIIFDETEGGLKALQEYEATYVLSISFKDKMFLEDETEAMKNEEVEEINESQLEEKMAGIVKRVNNLEIEMPDQDLDQFIKSTRMELNRMEDLLNKMDGLETLVGTITGLDQSNEIMLEVELADTQENIQIRVAENCTVYMVGQFSRAPIEIEAFLKMMEQDLENDFQQGFTFKIVNGKAVHLYQGWGELN